MVGITACMRCGCAELRMPGIRDGVIVGMGQDLSRMACQRCGLTAVPIEFDDEEARQAYEAERAKDPEATWPAVGWPAFHLPRK